MAAVALFTMFRTAFLAIDNRVVGGSLAWTSPGVGILVVPATDGTFVRGGAATRVVGRGRDDPSAAG